MEALKSTDVMRRELLANVSHDLRTPLTTLLAHLETSDADLSRLANDRAQQAKDWLETTGKIPGERLFIVAPRIGGGASRADEAAQAARPAAGAGAADGSADGSAEAPAAGAAKGAPAPIPRVDLSLK